MVNDSEFKPNDRFDNLLYRSDSWRGLWRPVRITRYSKARGVFGNEHRWMD
jgi:hypothetical protein